MLARNSAFPGTLYVTCGTLLTDDPSIHGVAEWTPRLSRGHQDQESGEKRHSCSPRFIHDVCMTPRRLNQPFIHFFFETLAQTLAIKPTDASWLSGPWFRHWFPYKTSDHICINRLPEASQASLVDVTLFRGPKKWLAGIIKLLSTEWRLVLYIT